MKKTIITLVVILAGVTGSYAQFEKGRMLVGGSLGFSSQTEKEESGGNSVTEGKTTDFTLDPQFGYFVMDNLAVGAGLGFGTSKWKSDDDTED